MCPQIGICIDIEINIGWKYREVTPESVSATHPETDQELFKDRRRVATMWGLQATQCLRRRHW